MKLAKAILFAASIATASLVAQPFGAYAADLENVHVAKSISVAWAFIPIDIGIREGIFAKYGLSVDTTDMAGDAKLQQAIASDAIDFGVGSGPSMALAVKGASAVAVAAFAAQPRDIAIVVAPDSAIKSVKDLKGKMLAVSTVGSLTDWLAKRVGVQEGWGPDGVKTVALGTFAAFMSALKTHQIDGIVTATEAGYTLEEHNEGKILAGMEDYAPKFHTHVLFARKAFLQSKPDVSQRFVDAFLASITYMKANKDKTSAVAEAVLNMSPSVASKTYDYEISMLEEDGRFDPDAIEVLKTSFVEMGMLDQKPTDDELFTTKFLRTKP